MKFSRSKFIATVFFQLIFLFLDIAFNVMSDTQLVKKDNYSLLLLYVVQDACILMSLTLISISMFRTQVFKSGFILLLLQRFKLTLLACIVYLLLTIALQTDILLTRWNNSYNWDNGIGSLYFIQRIAGVFYYYLTKRSALRLSDPRLYDEQWVKHTVAHQLTDK